jgi:hypothetical protein
MRPLASFQLPVSNHALLLPMTLVDQLRPLATAAPLARPSGATADLCGNGFGIAFLEWLHATGTAPAARPHHQQIGAQATDTVCRQGGDEFVILLAEIEQPLDATYVAEKLLTVFAAPHQIE